MSAHTKARKADLHTHEQPDKKVLISPSHDEAPIREEELCAEDGYLRYYGFRTDIPRDSHHDTADVISRWER